MLGEGAAEVDDPGLLGEAHDALLLHAGTLRWVQEPGQHEDREGARPYHSAVAAAAGGTGHRVNRRAFVSGLVAALATPLTANRKQ